MRSTPEKGAKGGGGVGSEGVGVGADGRCVALRLGATLQYYVQGGNVYHRGGKVSPPGPVRPRYPGRRHPDRGSHAMRGGGGGRG